MSDDERAMDAPTVLIEVQRRPSEAEKVPNSPEEAEEAVKNASFQLAAFLDVVFDCKGKATKARRDHDRQFNLRYDHHQAQGEPAHMCKVKATLDTFTEREAAEQAENLYAHAILVMKWREKDLLACQTIASSIRSTFGPMSSGVGR